MMRRLGGLDRLDDFCCFLLLPDGHIYYDVRGRMIVQKTTGNLLVRAGFRKRPGLTTFSVLRWLTTDNVSNGSVLRLSRRQTPLSTPGFRLQPQAQPAWVLREPASGPPAALNVSRGIGPFQSQFRRLDATCWQPTARPGDKPGWPMRPQYRWPGCCATKLPVFHPAKREATFSTNRVPT